MKSKLGEIGSSARGLLHADGQAQPQPKVEIEMNELGAGRARFDEPTADAAPNPADVEDHREVDLTYFHPPNDRQQHAASTRSRPGQAAKAANIRGEPMERSDPIGPSDDAGGSDFQGDAAAAYYDPSRVLGEQLRDESNSYQPMQPCFDAEDIRDLLRYLYLNACPSHAVSAADVRVFESACVAPRSAFGLGRAHGVFAGKVSRKATEDCMAMARRAAAMAHLHRSSRIVVSRRNILCDPFRSPSASVLPTD